MKTGVQLLTDCKTLGLLALVESVDLRTVILSAAARSPM